MPRGRIYPSSASAQRDAARLHTHTAYRHRNELLLVLSAIWPSHLMPTARSLAPLDSRVVLCIHSPSGQLAYVISAEEAASFSHLERLEASHWDGTTQDQRTDRLVELARSIRFESPHLANFWSLVDKTTSERGCWLWLGEKAATGYGYFTPQDAKPVAAHRHSWLLAHPTDIIKGLVLMHTCDVPSCVNPAHLQPGTHKQNSDDKIAKGRAGFQRKRKRESQPS